MDLDHSSEFDWNIFNIMQDGVVNTRYQSHFIWNAHRITLMSHFPAKFHILWSFSDFWSLWILNIRMTIEKNYLSFLLGGLLKKHILVVNMFWQCYNLALLLHQRHCPLYLKLRNNSIEKFIVIPLQKN